MFTGLVEELAILKKIDKSPQGARFILAANKILGDMQLGDSIAVNGVCLTVVERMSGAFAVEAVPETMRRTNLGLLQTGDEVHVERALPIGGRLGGHLVSGHIDGTGTVREVMHEGMARVLTIAAPAHLMKYIVHKGSVCIDGVSLTVMEDRGDAFTLSIIPHTGQMTTLASARPGRVVNIECDVLAKYLEKLLQYQTVDSSSVNRSSQLSLQWLAEHGFA
ncbi:riboflavin synthase [Alicyclobacillus tolerans]|uniref:Riboflavin synthase n=2 Tax=Alicyclobacillus tolerans TaxID=90970 RepID=A0A1M6Y4B6_9BACL|nr:MULTISPECIES: riboflavin synthase [Alicyclobacillus]MDP9727979.1 riboflavin synthase [Alicyclobacillus tengchongensis]SHL13076.1 riboflavin synthase alpha chain [Alicyclobacillus montanus]